MILGTGIDIVEVERIEKALKKKSFLNRVFTAREQVYCEEKGVQKNASYAARFSGKEAVMKAFGTGMAGGKFQEIEILPDAKGCPVVSLSGQFARLAQEKGIVEIHISLTHTKEYAAAQVIFWGGDKVESCHSKGNS